MERKLVLIINIYIIGLLISYFNLSINLMYIIIVMVFIYIFYNKNNKMLNVIILMNTILALGIINYNNFISNNLTELVNKNIKIEAEIISELKPDEFIINLKKVNNRNIKGQKVRLKVYNSTGKITSNMYIAFNSKLNIPKRNTNPKLFNFRNYLKGKGILYTCSSEESSIVIIKNKMSNIREIKSRILLQIDRKLQKYLDVDSYKLINSIILCQNILDDEVKLQYSELGISHILAASGLHIGLLVMFIESMLFPFKIDKKIKDFIISALVWFYAYIIDFPPSIVRAGMMYNIYILKSTLYLPYYGGLEALITIFIMLLIKPYYIHNLSFILSSMATIGIKYIYTYLNIRLSHLNIKILDKILPTLSISIFLLPIQMYYFNKIKPITFVSNLIVIPIVSLALVLSLLMLLVPNNLSGLLLLISTIVNKLLHINSNIIYRLNKVPFSSIDIFSPSVIFIIYYYLLIFVILQLLDNIKVKRLLYYYNFKLNNKNKEGFQKFFLCTLIVLIILNYLNVLLDDNLVVEFLDVSQGDCCLIKYRRKNILIDTGGTVFGDYKIGKNITLPYLIKNNIRKIDLLFISHFDKDHYEALYDIIPSIEIDRIYCSYLPDKKIQDFLKNNDIELVEVKKGDIFNIKDKLAVHIIYPEDIVSKKLSDNEKSLVILLKYNSHKVLFTGDIESYAENKLLGSKEISNIDILKVPHHGSNTSSSAEFIEKTNPSYAIISVGRNNRFNHPSEDVLERYNKNRTKILRTDTSGRIKIILKKDKYYIYPYIMQINHNYIKSKLIHIYIYFLWFFLIYVYIFIKSFRGEGYDRL